jgi:hypothetical protein
MMRYLYILLFLSIFSSHIMSQSSLKHNELEFSNGTGFTDTISEDLPVSSIPGDITYDDYLSYIYGFNVYDLGTVNVSGGVNTNVLFGQFVGDYSIPAGDNVFTGIEGLTEAGKKGFDDDEDPLDYNAFSDVQISTALNSASIWMRSNSNDINQIDAYASIDVAFQPIGQMPLSLQAEDGDINIQGKFFVESSKTSPTSTRGKVGIGTIDPDEELHVVGNVKMNQLFGLIGDVIPLDYYYRITSVGGVGNATIPGTDSTSGGQGGFFTGNGLYEDMLAYTELLYVPYEINVYLSEFNTNGWGSSRESLVFLSWYGSTHLGNQGQLAQFYMYLYEDETIDSIQAATDTTVSTPIAVSQTVSFDFNKGDVVQEDFTVFLGSTLQKDKNYVVKLVGHSAWADTYFDIFRISGAVFTTPSGS